MKTRALLAVPLALLLSGAAQAQQVGSVVTYGVSFPSADTKDFTGGTSWRNFSVDLLTVVNPNTTVGVSFGWNVFDEITPSVSSIGGVDIAGTQFRYVNSLPMLVNVRRFLGARSRARPYIGIGVGPHLMKERVDVGLWSITEDTWRFGVAPEVGLVMPLSSDARAIANVKYNYATSAGDAGRAHSYFGLNLGFAWGISGRSF